MLYKVYKLSIDISMIGVIQGQIKHDYLSRIYIQIHDDEPLYLKIITNFVATCDYMVWFFTNKVLLII